MSKKLGQTVTVPKQYKQKLCSWNDVLKTNTVSPQKILKKEEVMQPKGKQKEIVTKLWRLINSNNSMTKTNKFTTQTMNAKMNKTQRENDYN